MSKKETKPKKGPIIIDTGTIAGDIPSFQKSRLVHNIEERFDAAFGKTRPKDFSNAVGFFDVMMVLKSRLMGLGEANLVVKPCDIPKVIKKLCSHFVQCTKTETSFIVFDKGRLVRETKKQEQIGRFISNEEAKAKKDKDEEFSKGSREKKPKKKTNKSEEGEPKEKDKKKYYKNFEPKVVQENDGISHTERRPYITLFDGFPHDWDDSLSHRLGTLPHIINVVSCWLLGEFREYPEGADAEIEIPEGTKIIIDGHCLQMEDIERLGIELPDIGVEWDDDRLYGTPICYEHAKEFPFVRIYLLPELFNAIGEADEAIFCDHFNWCKMNKRKFDALIVSWDTDLLLNSLAYFDRFKRHLSEFGDDDKMPALFLKRDTPEWVFLYVRANRDFEKWIDINLLHQQICSYPGLRGADNPIWNVLCALILAGGDYTYNFYMVTHERFLDAILNHFDDIGNLVELDEIVLEYATKKRKPAHGIGINAGAMNMLIKIAYILAMTEGKEKEKYMMEPGTWPMNEIRKVYKNYAGERKVPGPKTLELRILQTFLKMIYMIQIGCDVQYEPDPYLYGYVEGVDPRDNSTVPLKKRPRITE